MSKEISRLHRIGDWVFEVKMVRALKTDEFGEPYSAVSNLTLNGDNVYIDSQLSRFDEELTREDCNTLYEFCESMGAQQIHFDRMRNGKRVSKVVDIIRCEKQQAANDQ